MDVTVNVQLLNSGFKDKFCRHAYIVTWKGYLCIFAQDMNNLSLQPSNHSIFWYVVIIFNIVLVTIIVVPENIYTSPTEGIFLRPPHPFGNS